MTRLSIPHIQLLLILSLALLPVSQSNNERRQQQKTATKGRWRRRKKTLSTRWALMKWQDEPRKNDRTAAKYLKLRRAEKQINNKHTAREKIKMNGQEWVESDKNKLTTATTIQQPPPHTAQQLLCATIAVSSFTTHIHRTQHSTAQRHRINKAPNGKLFEENP